jgi:hypothetical protein
LPSRRPGCHFQRLLGERQKTHDPRKSIAERYSNGEDYIARYKNALNDLVKQRWILEEDREALLRRAEQEWAAATQ